jgi:hypothetical protein
MPDKKGLPPIAPNVSELLRHLDVNSIAAALVECFRDATDIATARERLNAVIRDRLTAAKEKILAET